MAVRGVLLFEKWFLIVLYGVFGVKEIIDVSKTQRGLERSSSIYFFFLFTHGLWAGLPCGVLAFQIFFLTSLLLPNKKIIIQGTQKRKKMKENLNLFFRFAYIGSI